REIAEAAGHLLERPAAVVQDRKFDLDHDLLRREAVGQRVNEEVLRSDNARSPKRRATSSNAQPPWSRIGNSISTTISSGARQLVSASTKKSCAAITRRPSSPCTHRSPP